MVSFRLPVSGLDVLFRQTTGAEDIMLVEEPVLDIRLAVALVNALGRLPDGGAVPWSSLPVTDLDAALLAIRRLAIGDQVRTSVVCAASNQIRPPGSRRPSADEPAPGCQARIDISFRIDDYLAHHAPGRPRGIAPPPSRGGSASRART